MISPNPMALNAKALEAALQSGPLAAAIVDRHGIAVKLLWREALADPTHGDEDILNPAGAPHRTVPLGIYVELDPSELLRSLPQGTVIGPRDVAGEPRKTIFNAFTNAARLGFLEHIGYGRYRRTAK